MSLKFHLHFFICLFQLSLIFINALIILKNLVFSNYSRLLGYFKFHNYEVRMSFRRVKSLLRKVSTRNCDILAMVKQNCVTVKNK